MAFTYHPDGKIYRNNRLFSSLEEFKSDFPEFPIIEGEFFEYKDNGQFFFIHNVGGTYTAIRKNPAGVQYLIDAINNLPNINLSTAKGI